MQEGDEEGGTPAFLALEPQPAAVQLDQRIGDVQAQPHPAGVDLVGSAGAEEEAAQAVLFIGWNADAEFETDDFAGQVAQALRNIVAVLAEAGAKPEHIVRLTWYVTDKAEYLNSLKDLGRAYKDIIGRHYPAMALVQVVALVEDRAKVEIEATAVIPD